MVVERESERESKMITLDLLKKMVTAAHTEGTVVDLIAEERLPAQQLGEIASVCDIARPVVCDEDVDGA